MATPLPSWLLQLLWIAALVVMAALTLQQAEADGIDGFDSVKIRNELPRTLTVHCRSRDDDRGIHYVPAAQEYYFQFKLNFWQTTEYWCRFVDGQRWNSFGVWTPPGAWIFPKYVPCWKCLWVASVEGFSRAEEGRALLLLYPWRERRTAAGIHRRSV